MIEVLIDGYALSMRARSGSATEMLVLSMCREAAIPVKGVFLFKGVERGSLYWEELQFDKIWRICWYDTDETPRNPKAVYKLVTSQEGDGFEWRVFKNIGEKQ